MRYKIGIITVVFLLLGHFSQAQNSDKKISVGLFYSLSKAKLGEVSEQSFLDFSMKKSSEVGINIVYDLENSFALESGLSYSLFDVEQIVKSTNDTTNTNLSLIQIPFLARFSFSDYVYINGGLLFDFDMNSTSAIASQTGVGLMAGLGLMYQFSSGLSFYAHPYIKAHSLLRFNPSEEKNKLFDYGVKLGLAYQF